MEKAQIDKNILVAKVVSGTMIITIIYMTRGTENFHHEIFFPFIRYDDFMIYMLRKMKSNEQKIKNFTMKIFINNNRLYQGPQFY